MLSGIGVLAAAFQQWSTVDRILDYLLSTMVRTKFGMAWKNPSKYTQLLSQRKMKCDQLNLGIAHGILGPALFLTRPDVAQRAHVTHAKLDALLKTIDRTLREYRYYSVPPYLPEDKESRSVGPPSGWCYGDLSLGYAAVKIGDRLGIKHFIDVGSEIAIRGLRRNHKDTKLQEQNLCHGFGSAVLISDRLFRITKDQRFKALNSYWKLESELAILALKPKQIVSSYHGYFRGLLYSPMGVYIANCESSRLRNKKWDQFMMTEVD
jgi:hypothetical protein